MSNSTRDSAGQQSQESRQSGAQGESKSGAGKPAAADKARAGIGSSQGQDKPSRERPSAGTADIERGSDVERGGGDESLVHDPVGAYKERP